MPKSRRRRSSTRRPNSGRRELQPWMRNLFLADEAECRGDAADALALMEAVGQDDHDRLSRRPGRMQYLAQFAELGPVLPRWAHSRWILAQAGQWLDADNRRGVHSAMQKAIDVRGGAQCLPGHDAADSRARVMDHDWV